MKVTALEIRQREFALRFRGYDPTEVDTFLELVAGQVEDLAKENARLREALAQQEGDSQRIRQGEDDWKKALMTAQQITEELIGRAQRRAQAVLAAAKRKAHQMLLEAENGRQTLAHDVHALTRQKRQLLCQLRRLLEQHLALLETHEGDSGEQRADDGSIAVFEVSEVPNGSDQLADAVGSTRQLVMQEARRTPGRPPATAAHEALLVEHGSGSGNRYRSAALSQDRPA
jgi:cell division initiation protein